MNKYVAALVVSACALTGSTLHAQTTIHSGPALHAQNAGFFGYIHEGQTFQAPTVDNVLNSFTFNIWDGSFSTFFLFQVFVWDGNGVTGPALFSATSVGLGDALTQPVTFSSIGLALDPSLVYVAALSRGGGDPEWGIFRTASNTYAGGDYVRQLTSGEWTTATRETDAAFTATFGPSSTVTPEPLTITLLGTGLAGLGALRRRRRKTDDAPTN